MLYCTVVGWNGEAHGRLFLGTTLVASQQWNLSNLPTDQAGIFSASATPLHTGRYRWEVVLMNDPERVGKPDASTTFQVTNWLSNAGPTRLNPDG